mgnify:CR=1 FL=1
MVSILTPKHAGGPIGGHNGLRARLYPNGECVIYKPRAFKMEPMAQPHEYDEAGLYCACMRAYGGLGILALCVPEALGLSPLRNFDKSLKPRTRADEGVSGIVKRYGTHGITSSGARIVRNAAYLIEREGGKHRAVFATCTVPSLPMEGMRVLHENWHKVIDMYRLRMKRILADKNLSGELITVSEVQEKRYERTGIPVLHIHSLFIGKTRSGKWAISTKDHDRIWRAVLSSVIGHGEFDSAACCNLQRVKKSAEGYIGKYMTKGSKCVRKMSADGFTGWLPKQWWSCSRSLRARVDAQTRSVDSMADWLNDMADIEGSNVWLWHRDVSIDMRDGHKITIARCGRLSISQNAQIQEYLPDK